ncbi:LapA family protein [bacterium BD-1]|nr:LapA family protein [Ottowia caeni]
MTKLSRLLKWILKAAIFFALFAFALNNQHDATVHLLFGHQWRGPMMLIVLAAFAFGVVVGVLGMLPGWWRRRATLTQPALPTGPGAHTDTPLPPTPPHGI